MKPTTLQKKQAMIGLLWVGIVLYRLWDVVGHGDKGHFFAFCGIYFLFGCVLSFVILYNPPFWRVKE
jgi:hypothetical protein